VLQSAPVEQKHGALQLHGCARLLLLHLYMSPGAVCRVQTKNIFRLFLKNQTLYSLSFSHEQALNLKEAKVLANEPGL
jgi:hypothetical protein